MQLQYYYNNNVIVIYTFICHSDFTRCKRLQWYFAYLKMLCCLLTAITER